MPFKSEKQRRYLWANEPEIARDWTDTYGSRVKKQLGGTLNIGYHGSPFYQNIMSGGFKGSRIPTWAGFGKTFTSPSSNVAMRYGVPLEIAQSSRNFTLPFGGGLDKSGISLGGETPLNPKQATKGMRLMEKLRSGVYSGSPMAQRLLSTGTTSMPAATTGSSLARALFGPLGLTSAYVGGASALQENIPEELQGVISDDIISQGAMGAAAGQNPEWDAILRGSTANVPEEIPNQTKKSLGEIIKGAVERQNRNPHNFEFGNQWQTAEDEPSKWNWGNVGEGIGTLFALANETMPWSWARRGWDALTSGFSGQRTPRDPGFGRGLSGNVSWAGQRYDKQHGTGAYKDKKIQDWYTKYGHINYKTKKMQQKKAFMKQEADRIAKEKAAAAKKKATVVHPTYGSDRGHRDQGGGYSTRGGFTQATQSSPDTGRGHHSWAQGGRVGFLKGGLASLWPR
jgi:hypothetical protein